MFPNFSTFVQAITIYRAIRAFYDTDNVGFGLVILTYVRQLAAWIQQGLYWTGILMCAIGHFRKYQSTRNISGWIDVDIQLYAAHIARAAIGLHDRKCSTERKRKGALQQFQHIGARPKTINVYIYAQLAVAKGTLPLIARLPKPLIEQYD